MKVLIVTLFACYFAACFVQAVDPTCSEHPIFNLAKPLLTRSVAGNSTLSDIMANFIEEFGKATPTELTADQLGVCSQYAGQSTCCTEKLVKFLDKAAAYSASVIQKRGTPVDQLIRFHKKFMEQNSCSNTIGSLTVEDILKDPKNFYLKNYYSGVHESKLSYSLIMAAVNRGSMCSICAGVDTVMDFMSNSDVIVDSTDISTFLAAINTSWNYLRYQYSNGGLINLVISQLFNNYANTSCKDTLQSNYQNLMMYAAYGFPYQNTDPEINMNLRCTGKVMYNEKPLCEDALTKAYGLDEMIDSYTPSFVIPGRRNLVANAEDAIAADPGQPGIKFFLESDTDFLIQPNGDLYASFDDFSLAKPTPTNQAESYLSKLEFFASLTILAFLAI